MAYALALRNLMRAVAKEAYRTVMAHVRADAKVDPGMSRDLVTLMGTVQFEITPHVVRPFQAMADGVEKANVKAAQRLFGVRLHGLGIDAKVAEARAANIALIKKTSRDLISQIGGVLGSPDIAGMRVEDVAKLIKERAGVSESRAILIARDQTLKLNGDVNQIRQTEAGVTEFEWSTSEDERVREEHEALDGQTFTWAEGAPEEGFPGQPVQCRCCAIAVI